MNKFAIITGASSGIGREFANRLAQDNYDLLLVSRDQKDLKNVAAEIQAQFGAKTDYIALDLTADGSIEKLWKRVGSKNVQVLINNAGFGDLSPVVKADWAKLQNMITLNISALTQLSQLAAQSMKRERTGCILNVASIAAFIPGPGMATYYATKAYVLSFSEALSQELSGSGVSVTALCPGPTKTHFAESAGADKSGLFTGNIPTAADVAAYGYKAMLAGKVVAVHGFKNKLSALVLPRLLPRFIIRKAVSKIQNE
jgi:short-subunit dehydrogenase